MTSETWIGNVMNLHDDPVFQSEVAQIRAKALLKEITGQIPPYKWSYIAGRVIRNISAATFSLEVLSQKDSGKLKELETASRQLALVWESLAKLAERTTGTTALMNAAITYELAGYQANAACLARKIGRNYYEINAPKIEELASLFLQRLFLQVLILGSRLRKEPKVENVTQYQLLEAVATASAGEAFAGASRYFLNGDEGTLAQAERLFDESQRSLASLGFVEESNLVRSLRSLLPTMKMRATWTVFGDISKKNPRWRRYLKLLSRGLGLNVLSSPSVSELWPSQLYALEKGLLDSTSSKVVRMPTSAGKTRIAELAIVHTLVSKPGAKCVYIAPYRALVYELEQAFLDLFGDLGFRVSSVIGTYESDDFEELLVADADILVMTPEKLDLLQRAKPEFLNNVRLFVLDEGQIVQDRQRGIKFELLLTRMKRRLPNARFLFLSAVVPTETLQDFARWFNADPEKDIMSTDWRPSIQRVAKFEWQDGNGVIRYSPGEDIPLLKEFVSGVTRQQVFEFVNPETGRINRRRFPETSNKAQTAAELAFKFAELGPVLVFCSQRNFVEAVARSLKDRLDFAIRKGEKIPPYFLDTPLTRSLQCAHEWLGSNHRITKLLSNGIAIHHGDLPDVLRKAIEVDFRNRQFRVLVATNTLAQGVNLPIRTVVVHSCWRHRIEDLPERIPARDYWNIAGRAGRAGRETEGTIIHIVLNESDERDYEYYLRHRKEVEAVQSALFTLLVDILVRGLSESVLKERIDPEILALLVEERRETLSEEMIQDILKGTLVQTQANRLGYETEKVLKAFHETAEDIKRRVPDKSYWPIYSSTGLQSSSCEILRKYISENKERISDLLRNADGAQMDSMVSMFLEACSSLPEMETAEQFSGSHSELLLRWLSGAGMNEILEEFGNKVSSPEDLANFIEDFATFRLPWGISAFMRIAMKEIGLENEDLSDFASFFPTMVKFGVPVPAASWALSAGIPFRKSAIAIAARYLEQVNEPSFKDFGEWLGKLHSEELRYGFGFEGPVLEEVSRALSRSGSNPLLREFSSAEEILPHETYVRGISYENRVVAASSARVGQTVDLARDYDNPVDHNAIRVQLKGQTLGYLDRQLAQLIAVDMDCGLFLRGEIVEVEMARVPQIKIKITAQQ